MSDVTLIVIMSFCVAGLCLCDIVFGTIVYRRLQRLERTVEQHRTVIGANVEGLATLRGRFTQIETQLGRTMRAAGVAGDPNAVAQSEASHG